MKFGFAGSKLAFGPLKKAAEACQSVPKVKPWMTFRAQEAAVLMPLINVPDPRIILTVRKAQLRRHAGQVSFPGGMIEPGEIHLEAAIRETNEELILPPDTRLKIIGGLGIFPNRPSQLKVHAFIAFLGDYASIEAASVMPRSEEEVEKVLFLPLGLLEKPEFERLHSGWPDMPVIWHEGTRIWGMTAYILHEYFKRILL